MTCSRPCSRCPDVGKGDVIILANRLDKWSQVFVIVSILSFHFYEIYINRSHDLRRRDSIHVGHDL